MPPPLPFPKTPRDTFIRRSSAGLRPSTRRPSGLIHSGPDLSPRIGRERERERERKKEREIDREKARLTEQKERQIVGADAFNLADEVEKKMKTKTVFFFERGRRET